MSLQEQVNSDGVLSDVATVVVPSAGVTIPVTTKVILLQPAATVTMTASPTIQTAGINAGTIVTLIGNSAGHTTLQRHNAIATYLRMANPNQTVEQYHTISFIFDGTYWCELSHEGNI